MTEAARIYGGSLYSLMAEDGSDARGLKELREIDIIFRANPEYAELMLLPSVPKEERIANLDKAFGGRAHRYIVNFLKLLTERGLIGELSGCLESYAASYNDAHGILPVSVVSALPLSGGEVETLRQRLDAMTGKKTELSVSTDPALIGGVKLTMDGRLYDGTVRARLDEVEKTLRDKVL